ncbi:uncharacterized protein E0L32_012004 [Thyridium curvatum]|uniref:Uncharacterized protein n=1 Tax=Thyridium curvatum TaxID=1093900 RepID=A0A507BL87_9PEZI|nr:uncharacterized protein E0L32_012004 [Thyridium curvatum]TPX17941.1 hypothetical protein E0L32_012004 [Thyridium curvatum]
MKALTMISALIGVSAAAFDLKSLSGHEIASVQEAAAKMNVKETVGAAAKEVKGLLGEAFSNFDPVAFASLSAMTELEQIKDWAYNHPYEVAALAAGLGITFAPGIATTPLLAAAGFGEGGVAAGSFAAGAQSLIGNVVGGSAFAVLQSAGAGGSGLATLQAVAGAVAGAVTAVGGATAAFGFHRRSEI